MENIKAIVVVGTLEFGYTFVGPFDNADLAGDWVVESQHDSDTCRIFDLSTPCQLPMIRIFNPAEA